MARNLKGEAWERFQELVQPHQLQTVNSYSESEFQQACEEAGYRCAPPHLPSS